MDVITIISIMHSNSSAIKSDGTYIIFRKYFILISQVAYLTPHRTWDIGVNNKYNILV